MKQLNEEGNSIIICVLFVALIIMILFFACAIFFGETNSILYNIKLDMYSINKSAIISVNKGISNRSKTLSYDKNEYLKYFKEMIKKNYNLDENLSSTDGLVQKVDIKSYDVYRKGTRDDYTKEKLNDTTIHSVIQVKIKPMIFKELLEDQFIFNIHEDVSLNMVEI